MLRDPFEVLGIPADATLADARAAYRRLVELFHPDRLQGMRADVRAEGERRLREATEAMESIRASPRGQALDGLVGRHGLFNLFGSRRGSPVTTYPGYRRPGAAPDGPNEDYRCYNAQVRQVDPGGLHADWSGRHAAALWRHLKDRHDPLGPVFQVEWGAYECTLAGAEVRGLLRSALPPGEDWRGQPLETFERAGRRLIGSSAPEQRGSRDLGWLADQVEDAMPYLVTAEVY